MGFVNIVTLIVSIYNKKTYRFSLLDTFVFLFIGSVIISSLITHSAYPNTTKLTLLTLLGVLYFNIRIIFVGCANNRNFIFLSLCSFIILTALIEAIWGFLQLYGFSSSQHSLFKLTGSFFNPGPYAGYLAVIFPLALFFSVCGMQRQKEKKQNNRQNTLIDRASFFISTATCIASLCILPATMSRASWLAALSGSVVVLCGCYAHLFNRFTHYYHQRRKKVKIAICIVGIIFLAGITGMYLLKKDSADGRLLMWKVSFQMIGKHPFGVGLGNFSGAYGDAQASYFASGKASLSEEYIAGNPEYAFNEYLQIMIESGIVAFLLFILICIFALRNSIKSKKWGIVGGLLSLLVFAFFSYPFNILPCLILFVFFLAMSNPKPTVTDENKYAKKSFGTIFFSFFLFLFVGCSIFNQYPIYKAYKKWNAEKIYFHTGVYDDAIKKYEKIYPLLNDQVRFLFEYAQSLSKSGEYEKSNQVLKRAVQISCDPMLYNIMGKNHQELGEYTQAELCYLKSANIVPNRLYPWYLLTKLYDEMGLYDKSCETAKIVETKEPKVHSPAIDEMRKEVRRYCE